MRVADPFLPLRDLRSSLYRGDQANADKFLDKIELEKWLADSGWDEKAVSLIADLFFANSRWLAGRLATIAP
jgi:hypothetical protein